ncbi:uncharacterized protein BX663DRAFT_531409 [Cokeromyces recurvatus]|uniref:uncharacterized protein n=1 Tax=Cokeromyces recurvatus TaxID=90255 RepID=UPI0022201BC8|nr:uncharacterized protein BX663DRAFT_531409 [Cokeromyces recurvatus]KAI7902479.1 hypothetical protein BX663DRAFT_531409 [Cokeromyces recurvatus]
MIHIDGVGCVFIDPGRRDMLFCMGEKCESRHDGFIYRYTSNQRAKETKYLEAKRDTSDLLSNYYQSDYPGSLPFRKIKLSSYINRKLSDARLAKTLKQKFGEDRVLVLGNWYTSNPKYHEPIKGVGIRRMLKKEGLQVYLLDEYKMLSFCPKCKNGKQLLIFSFTRCTNQKYLAAVLNFRDIVLSHRQALGRPSRFKRETSKRDSTSTTTFTSKKVRSMPPDDGSPERGNTDRVNV